MRRRNRLFTAVLSLIMMLSLLPAGTLAEEEAPPTDLPAEEEVLLPEESPEEIQEEGHEELLIEEEQEETPEEQLIEEEQEEEPEDLLTEEEQEEEDPEAEVPEEEPEEETEPAEETAVEEPEPESEQESLPEPYEESDSDSELTDWGMGYNLWIGGVEVTSANQNNITGAGITGSVSYEGGLFGGTIYLDNATITSFHEEEENENTGPLNSYVIYGGRTLDNLTISVTGENHVENPNIYYGIRSYCNLTITGSGSLTVSGSFFGISSDEWITIKDTNVDLEMPSTSLSGIDSIGNLTISNSTVKVDSSSYGLNSYNFTTIFNSTVEVKSSTQGIASKSDITIEGNSKVTAEANDYAIFSTIGSINIDKSLCILEPAGGVISRPKRSSFITYPDGTTLATKVVIESTWKVLEHQLNNSDIVTLDRDYIAGEYDTPLTIQSGKSVVLDLNGHTLNRNLSEPTADGCIIINNGELLITGDGILTGGNNSGSGGAVLNNYYLEIDGPLFTGNTAKEAGAVYNAKAAGLVVKHGTFSDNTATVFGGGAVVNYGDMLFEEGTIKNNTANWNGGGIWTDSRLTIKGGKIYGNSAGGNGGAVYFKSGTLEVAFNPLIKENSPSNLYMLDGCIITVIDFLEGASIGVTTQTAPTPGTPMTFTADLTGKYYEEPFFSDQGYAIFMDYGEAKLYADFPEKFEITMDQEYLTVGEGRSFELEASVQPGAWAGLLEWYAEDENGDPAKTLEITPHGGICELYAKSKGTAWVVADIWMDGKLFGQARCRVDVVEGDWMDTPVADEVTGVRLLSKSAAVNLYSTDYTRVQILPELPQNNQTHTAAVPEVVPQHSPAEGTGLALWEAMFEDEETAKRFSLRIIDDRTLEIIPTNSALTGTLATAASYSSAIKLLIDGTEFTTLTKLKLTVKKSLPKIKAKALTFNSYAQETKPLAFTGGTVFTGNAQLDPDQALPDWLSFNMGTGTLSYRGDYQVAKKGKVYLKVQPEGWAVRVKVTVSVSAKSTPPTVTFKPATLTLKPGTSDSASAAYTIKPALFQGEKLNNFRVTEKGKDVEGTPLQITASNGMVTVKANPTDGKAHTYKVVFSVLGKESALTVKTLADAKAVKLTLKTKGTIDLAVAKSPVTITASTANIRKDAVAFSLKEITKAKETASAKEKFSIRQSGNVFTLTAIDDSVETGSYTATIEADYESGTLEKTVNFTVKKAAKTPVKSMTLKSSGKIDVLRPGTSVKLTPVFKNVYGVDLEADFSVSVIMTYDGVYNQVRDLDWTFYFDIEVVDNKSWVITPRPEALISHKDKYKVVVTGCGISASKENALKMVQGKATIKQDKKSVTLLKTDCHSRGEVNLSLTDASLKGIKEVQFVSPKDKSGREYFALRDLGDGRCEIAYNEDLLPANIKKLKTQTVKLKVFLEGNETKTPNKTLTVKVNFK